MIWESRQSEPLEGRLSPARSKNGALPIMAASTMTVSGETRLFELPNLLDICTMADILKTLGAKLEKRSNWLSIMPCGIDGHRVPAALACRMRASFLLMGPLLARFGRALIPLPGGCRIGSRPVDLHIEGFRKLGARIDIGHGAIRAEGMLGGADIALKYPSVGATENIVMAACGAQGRTRIANAAMEPEIVDLCGFLMKCGASIKGAGTPEITVEGPGELKGVNYTPIPDRIETGTFMYAAAITRGRVLIENARPDHMGAVIAKLRECGVKIKTNGSSILVDASAGINAADIWTMPYPGFPTDMQAPALALASFAKGTSTIRENVFEDRLKHAAELSRMGANISIESNTAVVRGGNLNGADVNAADLRAGAALVLAGLAAGGTTRVTDEGHIKRGYDNFSVKLSSLGADLHIYPGM